MKYGLPEDARQKICDVLARYPQVEKAILYGSRAMGTHKNGSDIDLTLAGGEDLTPRVLAQIMDEIDDLLMPYTIDLSIMRDISDSDVLSHIARVGVEFYIKSEIQNINNHSAKQP